MWLGHVEISPRRCALVEMTESLVAEFTYKDEVHPGKGDSG